MPVHIPNRKGANPNPISFFCSKHQTEFRPTLYVQHELGNPQLHVCEACPYVGGRCDICEKNRILLLCTLTTAHTMAIIAVAVVGMENEVALRSCLRKVKEAMERMDPEFDWDVDYVMSDGATGIGSSAKKAPKTLSFAWSLIVFVAGWAALRAEYAAFLAFLAYLHKGYYSTEVH